jgi:hypothetical protein
MIILILTTYSISGMEFNYYIWVIALSLVILNYIINWLFLDKEIKERSVSLIRNLF